MRYILKSLKTRYTSRLTSVRKRSIKNMKVSVTYFDGRTVTGETNDFNTNDELLAYLTSGPKVLTIPTTAGGILVDIDTVKVVSMQPEGGTVEEKSFEEIGDLIISEYDLSSISEEQDTTLEESMTDTKNKKETSIVEAQKVDDEAIEKATKEFVSFRDTFLKHAESQKPFYPGIIKKMVKRGELLEKTDKMLDEHITDLNEVIKSGE